MTKKIIDNTFVGALLLSLLSLTILSCSSEDLKGSSTEDDAVFISAVDLSSYPEISNSNPLFYDLEGNPHDFLSMLKENGVNTVRLRIWVDPIEMHSGFTEVKQFSQTLKSKGFKTWLTLHYSDTWADPGNQEVPRNWKGLPFDQLKDSVYNYTENVVRELQPEYIQIGNEINPGFLHPYGHLSSEFEQFIELMTTGIQAVRTNSDKTEIILHYAGMDGSEWFYNQIANLDYDIIGLSYYPIWHGKSLTKLKTTMQNLSNSQDKKIVLAETAYPFTLDWKDWTNKIVGLEEHLILPDYPATPEGQKNFIKEIKTLTKSLEKGIGFCYWGAELIAWKGNEARDASPWENQALFDFDNKALPVLREFQVE